MPCWAAMPPTGPGPAPASRARRRGGAANQRDEAVAGIEQMIEAGLASRRSKLRERGKDPLKVEAEIAEERAAAKAASVGYSTDKHDPAPAATDTKGT